MVAFLRVYRQYLLCPCPAAAFETVAGGARRCRGMLYGASCRDAGRYDRRLGARRRTARRRFHAAGLSVYRRTAAVARRKAGPSARRFLALQSLRRRRAGRAASGDGPLVAERSLRRRVHHRPLPAGRSGRRGRQSHGPGVEKGLRFLGRHLLSAVYHALSVRLYLYCVGGRYPSRMARSTGVRCTGLWRQHPAGVVVPASVRRTGARVAQTPLHAEQTGAGVLLSHGRLQPESRFRVVSSISPSVSPAPRTLPRSGRADSRTFPESGWRCGW